MEAYRLYCIEHKLDSVHSVGAGFARQQLHVVLVDFLPCALLLLPSWRAANLDLVKTIMLNMLPHILRSRRFNYTVVFTTFLTTVEYLEKEHPQANSVLAANLPLLQDASLGEKMMMSGS